MPNPRGAKVISRTGKPKSGGRYVPPRVVEIKTLGELLEGVREIPKNQEGRLSLSGEMIGSLSLWGSGDLSLVRKPCVAVVGTRQVSRDGAARSRRIARELVDAGVVVVSGLARGVDTEALTSAIETGGRAIAVIGTPIDRAYPAENRRLQERIYREHLLVSMFEPGSRVYPSHFPERNKLMAAISDATVIIEASDTSGSLHQAAECTRLNRWLFIAKSVLDDPSLHWPSRFMGYLKTKQLASADDVLQALGISKPCLSE